MTNYRRASKYTEQAYRAVLEWMLEHPDMPMNPTHIAREAPDSPLTYRHVRRHHVLDALEPLVKRQYIMCDVREERTKAGKPIKNRRYTLPAANIDKVREYLRERS